MTRRGWILKSSLATLVLALAVPAAAQAVKLHPGDVIASFNDPPDSIARINPRSGAIQVISTGDHLKDPWQVTVTPRGRILVADYVDHSILSINPRTGTQSVVSTDGGFQPVGVGLAASGKLIVSDWGADEILSINPGSGARDPISSGGSLDQPAELAVAPSGRIFVATEGSTAPGLYAINPRTGAQTTFAAAGGTSPLSAPYAVALTAAGRVLFADYDAFEPGGQGAIFSIARAGGPLHTISSGQLFGDPLGLARSFQGPLFVAEQDNPDSNGEIIKVNPRNGKQTSLALAAPDLSAPGSVAVVPPRCFGRFATIVGSPKKDRLKGTRFADVIAGAGGKDTIKGLRGKDRICGGKGRDTLIGGPGKDKTRQ
jgi:hypothetical protein